MGNCTTNKDTHKQNNYQDRGSVGGSDEEELRFHVEIKNIRARQMPESTLRIEIFFGDQEKCETPEIEEPLQNYAWAFHKEFEYKTTKGQLKNSKLVMKSVEKSGKINGEVKISLYDIATGPVHQDFVVKMAKGYKEPGRLNFDVRMSQMINLSVKTKCIQCVFPENLKEKFYNFSLRMHSLHLESESDHSANFKNPLFANEETNEEDFQNVMDENKKMKMKKYTEEVKYNPNFDKMSINPIQQEPQQQQHQQPVLQNLNIVTSNSLKKLGSSENLRPLDHRVSAHGPSAFDKKLHTNPNLANPLFSTVRKDVEWAYDDKDPSAPVLKMTVSVDELVSGSFNFFLWADNETTANHPTTVEDNSHHVVDLKLIGECYVGINKFFFSHTEINFGEKDGDHSKKGTHMKQTEASGKNHKHIAETKERLWLHGISVGELIGKFEVESSPFYRQMIVGVRTEEGVQKSANLYIEKNNAASFFKNTIPTQIKNLNHYNDALKTAVFNLAGSRNPSKNNKYLDEIAESIGKIHAIVNMSEKESIKSFVYKNQDDLIESQKLMTNVAKRLMEYADNFPITLKPQLFETLTELLTRGELELNYMGFNNAEKKAAFPEKFKNLPDTEGAPKVDIKLIQKKLKVSENYQTFLYTGLGIVLKKLNAKGLPDKERIFVEQFSAVAYFRIPEFREKILQKLVYDDDVKITEWRGTDWGLYDEIKDEKKNKEFVSFFDWENEFYSMLRETHMGKVNEKILKEHLSDESWQNRIGKRGIAYYFFLENWAKLVNKTVVVKDHVPWQDLPGYPILLRSFLIKMKTEDVRKWPQAMINASVALLNNHKLLNPFVSILYNKTKLHDSSSVFSVYEHLNNWFTSLRQRGKDISTNFDYGYFFKGIYMVLESEHALNISKCLWLLYNNFNIFPLSIKQNLSVFLLTDNFYRLFLHWSWSVRQVFYNLLLYRFLYQHRTLKSGMRDIDSVEKKLLGTTETDEITLKKNLLNDFIYLEYYQKMEIIEKEAEKVINTNTKARATANLKITRNEGTVSLLKRHSSAVGFEVNFDLNKAAQQKLEEQAKKQKEAESSSKKTTRSSSMMFGVEQLNRVQSNIEGKAKKIESSPGPGDKSDSLPAPNTDAIKAKSTVINRKIFLYGKEREAEFTDGIPDHWKIYLERGYTEFKEIKAGYDAWTKSHVDKVNKLKAADQEKEVNDPAVPEISVKVPLDDLETGQSEKQEW